MNYRKLYRICREEGLPLKRRSGRKRARGTRTAMPVATSLDARWSLDFVADSFGISPKGRSLAVIDDCARECLDERILATGRWTFACCSGNGQCSDRSEPNPWTRSSIPFCRSACQ
jgi:hypothetical protein